MYIAYITMKFYSSLLMLLDQVKESNSAQDPLRIVGNTLYYTDSPIIPCSIFLSISFIQRLFFFIFYSVLIKSNKIADMTSLSPLIQLRRIRTPFGYCQTSQTPLTKSRTICVGEISLFES